MTTFGGVFLKRYLKYIKPHLIYFIIGPLMMITEVAGDVIMPKLMSLIINEGVKELRDMSYILNMGVAMVLLALVMMAGGVIGNFFAAKGAIGFGADLRLDVFRKVQSF